MDTNTPSSNRTTRGPPPPALNIESPALTQPFKEFVSRGLVKISVTFSPMGTNVQCNPLGLLREVGEDANTWLPYGVIKQRVEEKNLGHKGKTRGAKSTSNKQPLPLKSLTEEDFAGSDEKLLQRIRAVATAIGYDVAKSRVMTHKLNAYGHDDFEDWWASSLAHERALLLMDNKHIERVNDGISKLKSLDIPCPFRGSLPPPKKENEGKEKGQEKVAGASAPPTNSRSAINGTSSPPKPKGDGGKK